MIKTEETIREMRSSRAKPLLTWLAILIGVANILFALLSYTLGLLNHTDQLVLFGDPGALIDITFSLVGMLVAYHRPRHLMGWIYLMIAFTQGFGSFAMMYARYALITIPGSLPFANPMSVFAQVSWIPGLELLFTYSLLLFPNGRLPSPGWRVVAWLCLVPITFSFIAVAGLWRFGGRELLEHPERVSPPEGTFISYIYNAFFPLLLLCGLLSVLSLIYRYLKSSGIERAQIKWFTFAAAFTFFSISFSNFVQAGWISYLLLPTVAAIPLAAGMAILRYHLFDIDLIIRRTLLYALLSFLLAIVYFGSVVLLQQLFRSFTGQSNPVVIVLSTLLIAALFTPLRQVLQRAIDRRFFRQRYDAELALAAFRSHVRASVDIDQLEGILVTAVQDTLQPETTLLWLRRPGPKA